MQTHEDDLPEMLAGAARSDQQLDDKTYFTYLQLNICIKGNNGKCFCKKCKCYFLLQMF